MNKLLSCLIVDDQQDSIDLLSDHILKIPSLNLVGAQRDPIQALGFLEKQPVELLFLDIQMPGLTGLELVESLRSKYGNQMPRVVFCTREDCYALTGYEIGVADYLLKPVSFKRFRIAVDRLLNDFEKRGSQEKENFIFAESDNKKVRIDFEEVVFLEALGNYVIIAFQERKLTIHTSLTYIHSLLPEKVFVRIHKSFIASLRFIQAVSGNELLVPYNGVIKKLPIGQTYKQDLMKRLRIV